MNQESMQDHPHLDIPLEVMFQPELEPMGMWARLAHEMMLSLNPARLTKMAQDGELKAYLSQQQASLKEEALAMEKDWRKNNPLPAEKESDYMARAAWGNQAKQSVREILISRLERSIAGAEQN